MVGIVNRRQVMIGLGVSLASLTLPREVLASATPPITLTAAPGELPLPGNAMATRTLAYNGTTPGPVLRARQGDTLKVRFVNKLDKPSAVHWHGLRIANAMDGAAGLTQLPVMPGESFDYHFTLPDAGTYWYHPHIHGDTARQQEAGLYGVLIVDEEKPPIVDRDLILVIDDWTLGPDGQILPPAPADAMHAGRIGSKITINSKDAETIALAPNERVRLRLVNAANSRIANLAMAGFTGTIVAIDGHPVDTPFVPNNGRLDLPPGGRADIVVDGTLAEGSEAGIAIDNNGEVVVLVHLSVGKEPARRPAPLPPFVLARSALPAALKLQKAKRVPLVMEGGPRMGADGTMHHDAAMVGNAWTLNGKSSDGHAGTPLFSVKRGTLVDLGLVNKTIFAHAIHVHGHAMRVLHPYDDEWQPYWVDTVTVGDGETVHTAFIADNPGKWMIHCHMVEHQESGMATWFEVT
jgi:FtsP/CotA-like multicopper oxidase with cupredoxin domain